MLAHSPPLVLILLLWLWVFGSPILGIASLVISGQHHRRWLACGMAVAAIGLGLLGLSVLVPDGWSLPDGSLALAVLLGGVCLVRLVWLDQRRRRAMRHGPSGTSMHRRCASTAPQVGRKV
jgi:hypothetical protein